MRVWVKKWEPCCFLLYTVTLLSAYSVSLGFRRRKKSGLKPADVSANCKTIFRLVFFVWNTRVGRVWRTRGREVGVESFNLLFLFDLLYVTFSPTRKKCTCGQKNGSCLSIPTRHIDHLSPYLLPSPLLFFSLSPTSLLSSTICQQQKSNKKNNNQLQLVVKSPTVVPRNSKEKKSTLIFHLPFWALSNHRHHLTYHHQKWSPTSSNHHHRS